MASLQSEVSPTKRSVLTLLFPSGCHASLRLPNRPGPGMWLSSCLLLRPHAPCNCPFLSNGTNTGLCCTSLIKIWLHRSETGDEDSHTPKSHLPDAKCDSFSSSHSWIPACPSHILTSGTLVCSQSSLAQAPAYLSGPWMLGGASSRSPALLSPGTSSSTYLSWSCWPTREECCFSSDKTGCKRLGYSPRLLEAVPPCCHHNCTTGRPESSGSRLRRSKPQGPITAAPQKQEDISRWYS